MKLADKIARAEVAFSSYLIAVSSAIFGVTALILLLATDQLDTDPFVVGLFIGGLPWAILLAVGSILVIVGFAKRRRAMIRVGSVIAFAMWMFAGISFGLQFNFVTILVVVFPDLLYFGYIYLASSLKTFDRPKKA